MATSPERMDELVQAPAAKAGKPPITANPAFPWIVALWFAALLGIGSLIVPVALLERASTASGLAGMLPMAAPPLGFTAQSLVALVGTVLGAMLGFLLAKKIAAPKAGKRASAMARKVLNAQEDIGDFGIEGDDHDDLTAPVTKGRRRALAIEAEEGPSDFLNVAPVLAVREPREEPAEEPVAAEPEYEAASPTQFVEPRQEFQPLAEPRQVFQPDADEAEDEYGEEEPFELDASAALEDEPAVDFAAEPAESMQEPARPGFARQEFIAVANASGPVVEVKYAEPVEAAATFGEPLAFSPPSMAREDDDNEHGAQHFVAEPTFAPAQEAGSESEDMVSDKQIFEQPDVPAAQAPEVPVEDTTDTQGEGLVQLVQRLGSTLEKHREWSAEQAVQKALMAKAEAEAAARAQAEAEEAEAMPEAAQEEEAHAETPVPDEFDPAAAEDAAQAMAAWFGKPAATPAAEVDVSEPEVEIGAEPRQRYGAFAGTLAAVAFDDEGEDEDDEIAELAASFTLPRIRETEPEPMPRPAFDQPPASADAEVEAEAEVEADDTVETPGFASLNPFKRNAEEFVRIEEPEPDADNAEPAVLFPNQEARKAPAPVSRAFDPPASESEAAPLRAERPQPSNDDNERALREALLNLQRMGK